MEELSIVILNYLRDKEKKWTRILFYINDSDHFQNSENCVGLTPISVFAKADVFEQLTDKDVLVKAKATLKRIPSYKNPLDTKSVLTSINVNGRSITLL